MPTLDQIVEDIMAGDPATLERAGAQFGRMLAEYKRLHGQIPVEQTRLAESWKGTAATTFGEVATKILEFLGETQQALSDPSYETVMNTAARALRDARIDIK